MQNHTAELVPLIPHGISSVLEIGCADGRLTRALQFEKLHYTGVDFSTTLLSRIPKDLFRFDAEFYLMDGSKFLHDRKYDLIFLNAVIQNFDYDMIHHHLKNAVLMMMSDSTLIWGDVPDEAKRFAYMSGRLRGKFSLKGAIACMLGRSSMFWFRKPDIIRLAHQYGLAAEFFEANDYRYRFHVRFRKV